MKRLLFVSFAVLLSFGFTFKGDSNSSTKSEYTYLNKIHSSVNLEEKPTCPFIEGKTSEIEKKDSDKSDCPFLMNKESNSGECPYLKENGTIKSSETKPVKLRKLKIS